MSRRYIPTGQPRHKQAPGPKPETVALIARCRAALDAGVRRFELAEALGVTPGRVSMAMDYISRWDGGPPERNGQLPGPGSRAWMDGAACKGMPLGVFFAGENEKARERRNRERAAEAVCGSCPVRGDCLEWAISRPEKCGTWNIHEEPRAEERRRRMREACDEKRAAS